MSIMIDDACSSSQHGSYRADRSDPATANLSLCQHSSDRRKLLLRFISTTLRTHSRPDLLLSAPQDHPTGPSPSDRIPQRLLTCVVVRTTKPVAPSATVTATEVRRHGTPASDRPAPETVGQPRVNMNGLGRRHENVTEDRAIWPCPVLYRLCSQLAKGTTLSATTPNRSWLPQSGPS